MGIEDEVEDAKQDAEDARDNAQEAVSKCDDLEARIDELEDRIDALEELHRAKLTAPPKQDKRKETMAKVWSCWRKHKDEVV